MPENPEKFGGEPTLDVRKVRDAVNAAKNFCEDMFSVGDLTDAEYSELFTQLDNNATKPGDIRLSGPLFRMATKIVEAYQKRNT